MKEDVLDVRNSILTKYVGLAGFTVLVWDHLITFADEVEYIWKSKKGIAIYLFFLNRYLIPLSFVVNLWAYFSDTWSPQVSHLRQFFSREDNLKLNLINSPVVTLSGMRAP